MTAPASSAADTAGSPEMHRRRRRRRRDPALSQLERRLVLVIAALAALASVFSEARPSGLFVFDSLLTAAFAGVVTLAASRSKRWTLVWLAGIATAAAVGSYWVIPGVLALALCAVEITARHRNRVLGATIGALAVQAALNIPDIGFQGLPTLLAAVAVAPVLWSAYTASSSRLTRRIRNTMLIAAAVAVVAVAGLGVATLSARTHVSDGVTTADQALAALKAGHQDDAGQLFEQAATDFDSAHSALTAPWALPARLVPIAGQHAEALTVASGAGHDLATSAATAATAAPYQQLRAASGQVDLARVETMQAPVAASADALHQARTDVDAVRSGWLVTPVADKLDEFAASVDDAIPQAELASEALDVLPPLLGGTGTKHYLLVFTTPAETRFQGGFIGAYGELTASNGKVTLTRSGPIDELSDAPGAENRVLNGSRRYLERYGRYRPARYLQNLTASPDLPDNAAALADLYPQAGGTNIDGVIAVDPYGLAALLKLTGPVQVEGIDQPLTADNAAQFLLRDQYLQAKPNSERQDELSRASRATFDALTSRDLPSPVTIADALGPAVRGGHLSFTTFDPNTDAFLQRLGTTGAFLDTSVGDYLDVRVANAGGNKIDAYLTRTIDYQVSYDPATGATDAVATIELHNDAPSSGLPNYVIGNLFGEPPGTNRMYLSVFTPLTLDRAERDGNRLSTESQTEFGGHVYSVLLSIPPGATTRLELHLGGQIRASSTYRFTLGHQPLVTDDTATVAVRPADGAPAIVATDGLTLDAGRATWAGTITEPVELTATFAAPTG